MKREKIFLYETDAWHSDFCKSLQGVFTTKKALWKYLRAMKRAKELTDDDLKMLEECAQTQGRNNNYMIEEVEPNPKFKNSDPL